MQDGGSECFDPPAPLRKQVQKTEQEKDKIYSAPGSDISLTIFLFFSFSASICMTHYT